MSDLFEPVYDGSGYYNIFRAKNSMALLKSIFPNGKADEMNFVLFSTSGVHGSYRTLEDEEKNPGNGVTFLIVHPRLVTLQYGNVYPESVDDFIFLKRLRQTSRMVVLNDIG